jgi:hypothetical protein
VRGGLAADTRATADMTERDRAGDRAHALAHTISVIAAFHDPTRAGTPGDDADVMAPHHDNTNAGASGIRTDRRPVACKPEVALVYAEMIAEPPAAPCGRASARACDPHSVAPRKAVRAITIPMMAARGVPVLGAMPILMPACLRGRLREQNNCGEERKHSNEFLLHHHSTGYKVALPFACTRRIAMNGGRV